MPESVDQFTAIITNKIFLSLFFIMLMQFISHQIVRLIRKDNDLLNEQHRTWISRTKNITVLVIMVLIISLWWVELEKFAFSIAAVAVAIVIASKELIPCISGSILRASSNSFVIGDWIRAGDNYGEVIEHNLLSTIAQEIVQEIDFENQ